MPLRILIDARHLRDFGIGTHIRNLLQSLAGLDRDNRYVLVCHGGDRQELAHLPDNFRTEVYEGSDADLWEHVKFPLFVRRFSADLYHLPLNRVPLAMPRPYIVTIHDMSSLLFGRRSGARHQLSLYRARRGLRRASQVIAVSGATRRDVERLLGVPASRIRLIYDAPDPGFLRASPPPDAGPGGADAAARERRRVLERYQVHYPFILYAGSIRPQKNIPRLVEAFALLRGELLQHPVLSDIRMIIIGDDISRNPAVRRAVLHSRVEQAVRFLGFVPQDTLRAFYEAAAVFAFPSLYEGFGLPPLEAMACGTPVVASDFGSLPEVLGDAAVLVNPERVFDIASGLRSVLLDADLRVRLVERGFRQVRRFSWEDTASQVLQTYREVAAGRPAH